MNELSDIRLAGDKARPWEWPEEQWREVVDRVRAGRSLKPKKWKSDAKVAVAISFDSDHESLTLRWGDDSPGRLSQGQYAARRIMPRILDMLERYSVPATFFVPAVVALLHPAEQQRVVADGHEVGIHGWIHELNSRLGYDVERDLQMRSADTLEKVTGVRPIGIRTPSWDFSPHTLSITREMGLLYCSATKVFANDEQKSLLFRPKWP